MSIQSSIFGQSQTKVGGLFFDGVMREAHNYSITTTSHPIEAGANIVDHSFVNQREVELDIIVGDVYFSFSTPSIYNLSKRSNDALNKLNVLLIARKPLVVICNLAKYSNLLLVGISVNQDQASSSTLMATLTFKEALFVDGNAGSIFVNNDNDQYQQPQNSGTKQLKSS